jgi:hypothetical protein
VCAHARDANIDVCVFVQGAGQCVARHKSVCLWGTFGLGLPGRAIAPLPSRQPWRLASLGRPSHTRPKEFSKTVPLSRARRAPPQELPELLAAHFPTLDTSNTAIMGHSMVRPRPRPRPPVHLPAC